MRPLCIVWFLLVLFLYQTKSVEIKESEGRDAVQSLSDPSSEDKNIEQSNFEKDTLVRSLYNHKEHIESLSDEDCENEGKKTSQTNEVSEVEKKKQISRLLNATFHEESSTKIFDKNLSLREILMTLMPAHLVDDENNADSNSSTKEPKLKNAGELYSNTTSNGTSVPNATSSKKSFCTDLPFNETVFGDVQILNASSLQKILVTNPNITSRSTPARCNLVYFFSNFCPFSAQGSAYVNALARSLKNIPILGLNSIEDHSVNTRYGVMGTPSLILFHNGNVVARYNASEFSTFHLESFIHHFTNQVINSINVTSHDFKANLPSKVTPSIPYALYCAWLFLVMCGCCSFLNSEIYAKLKEAVLNNWREAEDQHPHDD